ncbi:MAG: sugar phosphate isomerase/epimerase [Acidobacteria bacterium]|nr:sugar phosphate isomerase/epimerase [Acidobacteriota bacterium]
MSLTRRSFLRAAAVGAAAGAVVRSGGLSASPYNWPIGCQTFPYGKQIDQDFPGTMKMLASAGIQSIELCSPWYSEHDFGFGSLNRISAAEFKRVIGDAGLICISSHVDMTELRGEKLPRLIAWAAERGLTQILVPSLDGPRNPTMDQVKALADEYNRIAAVTKRAGLQQGLHHEGFENSMVEGRRVFDVLFELLDPALVKFQFQMSTITSGMVADDYFTKHPGRFISMHLQDVDLSAPAAPPPPAGAAGAGRGRGGQRPTRPIGQGSIDWVKTFRAAKIGGVENYFIEMNEALMKASVPYLRQLQV